MSDVVVLIDREQGGRARLASQGLQLHSAFTLRWDAGPEAGVKQAHREQHMHSSTQLQPAVSCAYKQTSCAHYRPRSLRPCSYILDTLLRHGLVTDDVAGKVRSRPEPCWIGCECCAYFRSC